MGIVLILCHNITFQMNFKTPKKNPKKPSKSHQIRIFSTPTCSYCHTLKIFLDGKGLKYKEIDVSSNDKALKEMIEKSGCMTTPVIDIDGEFIVGFDKDKINKLLNI